MAAFRGTSAEQPSRQKKTEVTVALCYVSYVRRTKRVCFVTTEKRRCADAVRSDLPVHRKAFFHRGTARATEETPLSIVSTAAKATPK